MRITTTFCGLYDETVSKCERLIKCPILPLDGQQLLTLRDSSEPLVPKQLFRISWNFERIEGFSPFFNKNTKEIGNNNQNNNSRGKQQPVTYDAHTNIDL